MVVGLKNGVITRHGSMDDVPAVLDLTNLGMEHALGGGAVTLDELTQQWSRPDFQPERDSRLIYAPDGKLVAAAEFWSREPHVYPYFWGTVHPDYRGTGYGTLLMDWARSRMQYELELAPAGARAAIRMSAPSTETESLALFERAGCVPVRHFLEMQIDMQPDMAPTPRWDDGIRVRTYVPGQDDRIVHEVVEEAFRDHWGYLPTSFEEWTQLMLHAPMFDADLWFLAVEDTPQGEQVAGVSLGRMGKHDDPDVGYIMYLGVRRDYRRRGIALGVLEASFAAYHERGVLSVALDVDAASLTGATRLYEKAGMHVVRQSKTYELVMREGEELSTQTLD